MPQLLLHLGSEDLDWGVLAVYTCSQRCVPATRHTWAAAHTRRPSCSIPDESGMAVEFVWSNPVGQDPSPHEPALAALERSASAAPHPGCNGRYLMAHAGGGARGGAARRAGQGGKGGTAGRFTIGINITTSAGGDVRVRRVSVVSWRFGGGRRGGLRPASGQGARTGADCAENRRTKGGPSGNTPNTRACPRSHSATLRARSTSSRSSSTRTTP